METAMKPHSSFTRALALLGAALAVWAAAEGTAAAQQKTETKVGPPGEEQELFIDTINVSVVNVDVYVTDKDGRAVHGLTADDFELFEDGKPVAITNFYAVEGGRRAPTVAAAEPVGPAEPEIPGVPAVEPVPEDQRLRLIVYIDNFNIHPFNRNRVMRELRVFLNEKLDRDDQVMLATYDRSLHIRHSFTSDPGAIAGALSELEKLSGHAVHHDSERRDALRNIEESRSVIEGMNHARSYAQSTYNDLSFSISALKDIVDSLAGMPGRKAVLYVSDGLQMRAGEDVFYAVQDKYGERSTSLTEAFQFDVSRRFTELAAQANANRVSFYTIDAAGLRVYDSTTAEYGGSPGAGAGSRVFIDQVRISNLQAPLQLLAERTGGVAILNANNVLPSLEKIAQDFDSYYSLGYTPSHFGDGRYYKIEVKLKKPVRGTRVRHREGYRDKSVEARMTDGTLAALNFPMEDNPLGIDLQFGTPQRRDDGFFVVPVHVRIPLGRLVLVPRGQTHAAKLRLFVGAMDSDGGTSDVQQAPVPIEIPSGDVATAVNKHYVYTVSLLMRPGEQRIAVGLRDDIAAQASFLSRSLRVGGGAPSR
jgi:VWFA-related protein